jgi:hypothetical protein
VKQVYKPKQKEEVQKMEVDPERTSQDIIQIGSVDVHIGEDGKRLIVPNNKVVTSTLEVFTTANDHEWKWLQLQVLITKVVSSRFDSHTKEEASMPKVSREEGEGAREAKGRSFQPVQAHDTSGERVESQDQLPASIS